MQEEKDTKKSRKKKKKKGLKIFKITLLTLLGLILLIGVAGAGVTLAIINTSPPLDVNQILTLNEPSTLYDNSGQYMDDVATTEKRDVISIKDLPNNDLPNAFISIEDERFEQHKGIDVKRIAGVIYIDVLNKIKGKSALQGASTITQQLVRNTMLTDITKEKNITESAKRKVQEMYLSLNLEKRLSKQQILEAYMNTIPFGSTVYGVQSAARYYFNKDAKDLSLIQCAYIAGLPQSPTTYNAFIAKDPSVYLKRTQTVLNMMYKNDKITKEQYDKATSELNEKNLAFDKATVKNNDRLHYEWFSLPAVEQVKKDLQDQYHYSEAEIDSLLMYGGLKIYTTMDRNLQDSAQKVLNDDKNLGIKSVKDANGILQPQGSAVIMDYHTGEVKVIVGGRGDQPPRSFNRAAYNGSKEFNRPTGSSIKPLTVYSAAIDSKQTTAGSVIEDSPLPEEIGKKYLTNGKPYNPRNYETGYYRGYVTIRDAIAASINLVAIKLEDQIGLKTGAAYGEKYGLPLDDHDKTSIAALSLGQLHHGTNTLTMAAAYGTFGNNGIYTEPRLYTKVVDRRGITILESKVNNRKVISPQSAYIMFDLLKGPTGPGGTAPNARFGSMPVVGKTGTSGDMQDFWFSGLTPYLSGSVWLGDDTPKTYSGGLYSSTSAGIWQKIMAEAHKNLPVKQIEEPSGIVSEEVCKVSGKIPTDLCARDPRGSQVVTEMFIAGTQPTALCDVHVEAKVNKLNGKLATENTPKDLIESRVFIKRDYTPTTPLSDQQYVLPTEVDDTKPADNTPGTTENNNSDNNAGNTDTGTGTGTGTINNPGIPVPDIKIPH